MHGRKVPPIVFHSLLLALLTVTAYNLIRGVDFGYHWDEDIHLFQVVRSRQIGALIPRNYLYPSMTYWLTYFVAFTSGPQGMPEISPGWVAASMSAGSRQNIEDPFRKLRLRARVLFILLSLLTAVWVYLLVLAWRSDYAEALVAAAVLALSWEVNYHSRWIAPDAIMMQFAALTMMCVFLAYRHEKAFGKWLGAAAIAAGLATSTKYNAGVLLAVPLLAVIPNIKNRDKRSSAIRVCAILVALSAAAYLAITPGTIIRNSVFLNYLRLQSTIYHNGHGGYTVQPGIEHLRLAVSYLELTLPSRHTVIAAAMSLLALIGLAAVLKKDRWKGLVFLLMPVAYLACASTVSVLMVRNLIVLAPFMAVLVARGWSTVAQKSLRMPMTIIMAALLAFSLRWQFVSADTIVKRNQMSIPAELLAYVRSHKSEHFVLSDALAHTVAPAWHGMPKNVTVAPASQGTAVFMASEVNPWQLWHENRRGSYKLLPSGPYEMNWDYYASWQGQDRIVMTRILPGDPLCDSLGFGP
jgi:hypothetical protein